MRYNVKKDPDAYLQRESPMLTTSLLVLLTAWTLLGPVSLTGSQPSILQQRDGTTSTLTPLGGQDAIYSDAHGNKGVTHLGSGLPSHMFSSPHGAVPGSVTPFGTPTPPNLVTPAPLLPLQPRGMATPYPQPPPPHHPGVPADTAGSAGDRDTNRLNDQSGMILPQAHPPKSTVESLQVFR